jgi:hypothetical protein
MVNVFNILTWNSTMKPVTIVLSKREVNEGKIVGMNHVVSINGNVAMNSLPPP